MASEIKVDTISEKTSAGGVTIDGLLIKDGGISGDVSLIGTTPTFTIGDAGAEDATLLFDGNAQDFHIGLDDSADDLVIGVGSALGTTTAIAIDENANSTFSGTVTVNAGAVFNEASADVDFRVEDNNNINAFFVEGGASAGIPRIGIGTAAPVAELHTMCGGVGKSFFDSYDGNTGEIALRTSRNATVGGHGASNDGDGGRLKLYVSDGNSFEEAARIEMTTDAAAADGDVPGKISFYTTPDGTNSVSERMRIQSDGNISIGATASHQRLYVYGDHDAGNGLVKVHSSHTSADNDLLIFYDGNGTEGGTISLNASGNSVAYNTSSDYRLKENETSITDGITRIKQLKPYRFNFIDEPDKTVDGFFAHEVSGIVPEAIKGTKDAMKTVSNVIINADGTVERYDTFEEDWEKGKIDGTFASDSTWEATKEVIKTQGIDQAKLVPITVACLKDLITKIETLETKVTALENA